MSFRYREAKTGRMEQSTVSGAQFLWLVLQHVLPKGFRRARNFGFLHPNCKRRIALLHLLLASHPGAIRRSTPESASPAATAVSRGVSSRRFPGKTSNRDTSQIHICYEPRSGPGSSNERFRSWLRTI